MTRSERAAQIWALLALAARNRQLLTYDLVSRAIGAPRAAIGGWLAPIQEYCRNRELPPLTVLVVSEQSGLPGGGFNASENVPEAQANVFSHDWLAANAPSPADFETYAP